MPGLLALLPVQHALSGMRQIQTGHIDQASILAGPSLSVASSVPPHSPALGERC